LIFSVRSLREKSLLASEVINEPFVVINADDFYGSGSYQSVATYLSEQATGPENHCMVGFQIKHTLSDYGSVSRGICEPDDQDFLKAVVERTEIGKSDKGIFFKDENDMDQPLMGEEMVSMNIWGFSPSIFPLLEEHFIDFIHKNINQPKAELYIPTVVNDMVKNNKGTMKVLCATDRWFGVTYKEDKPMAIENIRKQIDLGIYPENLWK